MPPKKGARGAKNSNVLPLHGCSIALGGAFPGQTQASLERDFINPLGASLAKSVTASITHLIVTELDFAKPSAKVKQAQALSDNIRIVKLAWLEDCLEKAERLGEDVYGFNALPPVPDDPKSRKRAAKDANDDEEDPPKKKVKGVVKTSQPDTKDDEPARRKKKTKAAAAQAPAQMVDEDEDDVLYRIQKSNGNSQSQSSGAKTQSKLKAVPTDGRTNIVKSSDINIVVDEGCPLTHYRIYVDADSVIFDASLNQTNASNNNNKFYRLQLLQNNGDYKTWARWGRVGERGAGAFLGSGSLEDAIHQFEIKFKSKTGLSWDNRDTNPKPHKYTFIERSYEESDQEEQVEERSVKKEESVTPESKLHPAIQELLELIFNPQYFAAAMTDLNYDVNKLPLGKLSKNTITRGYQTLKDLSALLDNPLLAQSQYGLTLEAATEQLSNTFYSLIPHAFGRGRPPIISYQPMLTKEVELLDSLSDMKDAANIMKSEPKDAEKLNQLDRQFQALNMDEMTPLKNDSPEFAQLTKYLVDTRGSTHNANYQVSEIFRIERQGESDRFNNSSFAGPPRDRRLLWHGSRCTNFGGILSQGLRIAPPEAPVSGYMFGKGIYLADMSSKSANYCCAGISNGHALLLLCEAELGDPMQTLTDASYSAGEDAKSKGLLSTWGQGTTGPSQWKDAECVHPSLRGVKIPDTSVKPGATGVKNAYLMYNEYITYDVAQVRLRYLFRVKM